MKEDGFDLLPDRLGQLGIVLGLLLQDAAALRPNSLPGHQHILLRGLATVVPVVEAESPLK